MFERNDAVIFYSDSQIALNKENIWSQVPYIGSVIEEDISNPGHWMILSDGIGYSVLPKYMRHPRLTSPYNLAFGGNGKYGNVWMYIALGFILYSI